MTRMDLSPETFSITLFEKMKHINPAVCDMELYEFRYGLDNLVPPGGWSTVALEPAQVIEKRVSERAFYDSIQIKPCVDGRIVLDEPVARLTNMLLVGLAAGEYDPAWVNAHFYFDLRGFFFLHRTAYFTPAVISHLGGKPFRQFEQKQKQFEGLQDVGYKAFREANAEVDELFINSVQKLISARGTPIVLAIAGPTAAGKTEIVERLRAAFDLAGRRTTSIEMDNFLTDRDHREQKGIFTQGKAALHFELLKQSLRDITSGKKIQIPRYDFVFATSSHDLDGRLKPGGQPIDIEPADIVFIEGNFPFLLEEIAGLIGIKAVYLTDDPIRMKRKWKRDIDYRKKYEPTYFRNRYFKEQFIMGEFAYRPQLELCDLAVDTTGAALWATPEAAAILCT
ncbi:MAG: uridine kinase family protein [Bacteroidota bacterium]